ncbi:hypothetical protein DOTSEDRAFT_170939 [Dothistroma septosporum NZE10]|uniref:Fe2OG dioxygenase domain-containing protein n=1 Tax=Dothistroma septosporum (strain NZE10 / CBS 128990) TaxID=675120 RepID=N1PQ32_DOTSN|nr:hypothetical protein DOTSEDRAFT_170939 [Dothistroma septosporum NZE10]
MGSIEHDTSLDFADLPQFPSDVPTAPLLRVNLKALLDGNAAEEEKLWRACCDLGFFYLDLRHGKDQQVDGDGLLESAQQCFGLAEDVFNLPVEEKQKYDLMDKGSYFGYKGYGKGVVDKKGTRDRNEFWNISKDDILGVGERLSNPASISTEEAREKLRNFMVRSHAVVTLVLERLNSKLGLPEWTLQGLHRMQARSGDQVRWVRSPPQEEDDRKQALGEHTDFGSVTVLFNRLGGLQVLPPGREEWAYVKPLKGHCVVNLGDAMVKFTAGVLRSNLHRVVNPPGQQGDQVRYSLVYFNRPEDDVILKVLTGSELIDEKRNEPGFEEGEDTNAKQWILNRAMGRRVGGDWKKGQGTDQSRIEKGSSGVAAS